MKKVFGLVILQCSFFLNLAKGAEYTPVSHQKVSQEKIDQGRLWRAPEYNKQGNRLGYNQQTFSIPKGMRKQVEFWIDIYTKYTSNQGVLHDSEQIDLIYDVIDFNSIINNKNLNRYQKEAAKERLVKQRKKHFRSVLRKLQRKNSNASLTPFEKRIRKAFFQDKRKNKYQLASLKGRLRFQLGQRDRFLTGIYHFGRYKENIETIFNKHKIPLELTRLPFVESSYNIQARSRLGASGIWQIMPRTGRDYIRVSKGVDERNHPIIASEVAAQILKKNYKLLQSWPLALTGYNHGAYGIRKLVRKYGTRDLVKLIGDGKKKRFGFASKNFYATFLAALEVEKNANKYFGKVYYAKPLEYKKVRLKHATSYKKILNWFGGEKQKAHLFNTHITGRARKGRVLIPRKVYIYVPRDEYNQALRDIKKQSVTKRASVKTRRHRISRGESLSLIARRYGVSVRRILSFNSIRKPNYIKTGQVLLIPVR